MALDVGSRIAHYDVTALIGEGGMGQVYQATDTKLNRQVALKILPEAFAADPDRLARFQREAQVLASLNHPNIAQIHGIEEDEGTRALVLELVEGPTLADRISQGAIPLDEALPIAKQIAEALEAAHEAGVIHRDLKPANIKVREDGTVKVLDFGLAKALAGDASASGLADSPTVTAMATKSGVILGTAAYMSPEQARGKPLDKRTDVWAFGCVLYEILSGHRVFGKDTVIDTLSAVLESEPDWHLLPAVTPAGARRLLRRCLQKDRRRRCHDIADARIELDDLEGESADEGHAATEQTAASGPRTWTILPWALASGLGVVLVSTVWVTGSRSSSPPPEMAHLSVELPAGHSLGGGGGDPLTLSRDGQRLAYVAAAGQARTVGLFLRRLDDPTVLAVADTEGAGYPFFSPDGESVGFWADGWLQRVPFTGGQPLRIAAVPVLNRGAAWGPDDTIIFSSTTEGLQRVSVSGGTPEVLADDGLWPRFLDDGRLLFVSGREIQVLDLDARQPQVLYTSAEPVRQARVLPSGHLLYGSAGRVIALPIDPYTLEVTGTPAVVLESVLEGRAASAVRFDVAANGTVVFVPGSTQHSLVLVDRSGTGTLLDERRDAYRGPSLSPDGNHLAVTIDADPDPSDTWIFDIERGNWRRFTLSGHNLVSHWTPDGSGLSFCADQGRGIEPLLQQLDGGSASPLLPDGGGQPPEPVFALVGARWVVLPLSRDPSRAPVRPLAVRRVWPGAARRRMAGDTVQRSPRPGFLPVVGGLCIPRAKPGKPRCIFGRYGVQATQSSSRPEAGPRGVGGRTDASSSSGRAVR